MRRKELFTAVKQPSRSALSPNTAYNAAGGPARRIGFPDGGGALLQFAFGAMRRTDLPHNYIPNLPLFRNSTNRYKSVV